MLATVKGTCGHEYMKDIKVWGGQEPGPRQLPKQVKYWETRECIDCFKGARAKVTAKISKDLPLLTGSIKQVSWAIGLRANTIVKIQNQMAKSLTDIEVEMTAQIGSTKKGIKLILDTLKDETNSKLELLKRCHSAKFWIDTRDKNAAGVLQCADIPNGTVTTVWYAQPKQIITNSGRFRMVGGTKPHYTEHDLIEVK